MTGHFTKVSRDHKMRETRKKSRKKSTSIMKYDLTLALRCWPAARKIAGLSILFFFLTKMREREKKENLQSFSLLLLLGEV